MRDELNVRAKEAGGMAPGEQARREVTGGRVGDRQTA